jgi:hypothetical protein
MALISPRPFRLSIASASSVISGTVSTLYGGWFSVMRAMNVDVSKLMSLNVFFSGFGSCTSTAGTAMGHLGVFAHCWGSRSVIIRRNRALRKRGGAAPQGRMSP